MTRQIAYGVGTPPTALLEERIRRLESTVALLTHTVEALQRELTELTDAPPDSPEAPDRRSRPSR
jgi:hypothetical protein